MLREHHGRIELVAAARRNRARRTVVADFDHVAQLAAFEFARQQFQELAEIGRVEFLGRRELPEHRTEPVAELEHARVDRTA